MTILITGAAGFIGFHLSKYLLKSGISIIGVDNFNKYYDPKLKRERASILQEISLKYKVPFSLIETDIKDDSLENIFKGKNLKGENLNTKKPSIVVNLAAQAGVRYSIENPRAYIDSNITGFQNIIELSKNFKIKHFVYASSSSVYGGNSNLPFKESMNGDHPVSLYGATKKANELIAHSYSHLFNLPTTGLRFFTVYGPLGRPDMALFLFTKAIIENRPIQIFNNGDMVRDFTYISDLIESLVRILNKPPKPDTNFDKNFPDSSKSWAPYKIFNIGNSKPIKLLDYISEIEKNLGKKAIKNYLPMQPGDVKETSSDISSLEEWIDYRPGTTIEKGIYEFIKWYREFYKIKN